MQGGGIFATDPGAPSRHRATGALLLLAVACAVPAGLEREVAQLGGPMGARPALLDGAPVPASARDTAAAVLMRGDAIPVTTLTPGVLRLVPGIGAVRARDLWEGFRTGRIRGAEELLSVPGIGPTLAGRLQEHLRFDS